MLINCGACEDIREYLQLSPQARLIVVDSHRPIHARCRRGCSSQVACSSTKPASIPHGQGCTAGGTELLCPINIVCTLV